MEADIVVYPYQDVWRLKPSNSAAEVFSYDYPSKETAERAAQAWKDRQRHI